MVMIILDLCKKKYSIFETFQNIGYIAGGTSQKSQFRSVVNNRRNECKVK
jgi:hypothetical protein